MAFWVQSTVFLNCKPCTRRSRAAVMSLCLKVLQQASATQAPSTKPSTTQGGLLNAVSLSKLFACTTRAM